MSIDGILNINKPAGKTSFDIVALVRRLSGQRRVGHAGTLDPMATGVLLVGLGQGTRVIEFLAQSKKTYRAQVELGISTDTYDEEGKVTAQDDPSQITKEQVEAALASFRGFIEQTPPMYSAIKYQGKPLYQLARAGIEIARKPRKIEVSRLQIVDWQPPIITIEVECSKGTYIRSLAHDLGQALGCGAHLRNLVRLKSGLFDLSDSITIAQFEQACQQRNWQELVYPIDMALLNLKAAIVAEESERAIQIGHALSLPERPGDGNSEQCRAYSLDGRIVAVLRFEPEKELWQPEKVFSKGIKGGDIDGGVLLQMQGEKGNQEPSASYLEEW